VTWSAAELRDWNDFSTRLEKQLARYTARGIAFSPAALSVALQDSFDRKSWKRIVSLQTEIGQHAIRYSLDGTSPGPRSTTYTGPITLTRGTTLKAAAITGDGKQGPVTTHQVYLSPPGLKEPVLASPLDLLRNGSGPSALVDNVRASGGSEDTGWQGVKEKDFEAVIDLGSRRPVHRITTGFFHNSTELIFLPTTVEYAVSDDGATFRPVGPLTNDFPATSPEPAIRDFSSQLPGTAARYVKVTARSPGKCPDWHKRAGEPVWMYIDEVFVE
jgi:hexosaminidase